MRVDLPVLNMKKTKKQSKLNMYAVVTLVVAVVAAVGYLVYRQLIVPSQVAMIGPGSEVPTSSCISQLESFQAAGSCSNDGFTTYTYQCKGQAAQQVAMGQACTSYQSAYTNASTICGLVCSTAPIRSPLPPVQVSPVASAVPSPYPTCVPKPYCPPGAVCKLTALLPGQTYCSSSPYPIASSRPIPSPVASSNPSAPPYVTSRPSPSVVPSWPPTPPPTSDPSALVSCQVELYQLPKNVDAEAKNPVMYSSSALTKYRVEPSKVVAHPGDRYVANMVLTNVKPYALTNGLLRLRAWTENSLGDKAPFTVSAVGSNCNAGFPGLSIRCDVPYQGFNIGQTLRPNTYQVLDIARVAAPTSVSLSYKGIYSATVLSCPPITLKVAPNYRNVCRGRWPLRRCHQEVI